MAGIDAESVGTAALAIVLVAIVWGTAAVNHALPEAHYHASLGFWLGGATLTCIVIYLDSEGNDEDYAVIDHVIFGGSLVALFGYPIGVIPGIDAAMISKTSSIILILAFASFAVLEGWRDRENQPDAQGGAL